MKNFHIILFFFTYSFASHYKFHVLYYMHDIQSLYFLIISLKFIHVWILIIDITTFYNNNAYINKTKTFMYYIKLMLQARELTSFMYACKKWLSTALLNINICNLMMKILK